MRSNPIFALALLGAILATGCKTYDYRIVQPANLAQRITGDNVVTVRYDPLEYRFARHRDRLGITIANPTDDRITLLGDRSYVVDPKGETHPIRGRVIAPHSYTRMLQPPVPASVQVTAPYYGWGPGFYTGFGYPYAPFYDDFYYGPATAYYHIVTPYDWKWDVGPARFRFTCQRNNSFFDHNFEIVREVER